MHQPSADFAVRYNGWMPVAKERILTEIRRVALENGGKPPGVDAFRTATGIKQSDWRGRHWINWSQALEEAGFAPNKWGEAIPESELLERLAAYALELGHFPVDAELVFKRRSDPNFPTSAVFYTRFGSLQATADALLRHAKATNDERLIGICEARVAIVGRKRSKQPDEQLAIGSVYLMKSGDFYKIGLSNASGRREYELGIQLPEKLKKVHEIKTDCPAALESYWHTRFASKRQNGEWFELDGADIKAFKARKSFMFGEFFA